jgi:hypothetical protein
MSTQGSQPVAFSIRGPIARADLDGLTGRVCALLRKSARGVALCDVEGVEPDAVTVDALARLQLGATRTGCRVRLRNASPALLELVALMGLADVLPTDELALAAESKERHHEKEESMARMIFPNLAVQDLDRSVAFFTELGFEFDPRFTDDTATAMIVNEQASVMLLTRSKFEEFTTKELVDSTRQTEAIIALSADSREDVDAFADTALAAGGSPANEPMELGFMYGRSFHDPDGHQWEIFWLDPAALDQMSSAAESGAAA